MLKVFLPQDKRQGKTSIRGLWQDSNKIFYDYLTIKEGNFTLAELKDLCKKYNQLALFFTNEGEAFIYDNRSGKYEVLSNKEVLSIDKKDLKYYCKILLKKYNGVTIYNLRYKYLLEVWHK